MGRLTLIRTLLVAAAASCLVGGAAVEGRSAPPDRLPRRVEYTGTMTLDRRAHDACQSTVPPVVTADVRLVVDTDDGIVTGELSGSATGRYVMPATCGGADDTTDTGYEASTTYNGTISGTVDPTSGSITATADISIEGVYDYGWLPGMPEYDKYLEFGGGRTCSGTTGLSAFCSITIDPRSETATISGRLLPTAGIELAIDWYTLVCELVTIENGIESHSVTPEGCVTIGSFELQPGTVVWPRNDAPEIDSFSITPGEPDTNATITATATATDPDGDPVTYAWSVDGAPAGTTPSITFGPLTGGDHTVGVQVSDPAGESDTESQLLTVFVAEVDDADGDGVGDLDDACPDEPGEAADGCPELAIALGCSPARPIPEQPVACSVDVRGLRVGESLLLDWYLDGSSVQTGASTSWRWDAATEGEHAVRVDVVGEGRSASATTGFEATGGEVAAEAAGFSIAALGCNSGITSDEILACSVNVARDSEAVGALVVTWRVDGQPAAAETISGGSSGWSLDRPAPGAHVVAVTVVDPLTNFVQAASTQADVRRGSNTSIPPELQAFAAGATMLTVGAWLWLEMINQTRTEAAAAAAAALDQPPPRTDIPSWVDDPRPLVEIWAAEAAADAQRHGYTDVRWDPELNAFVAPDYLTPDQIDQIQRTGRDEWHQLVTTLEGAPGLSDLADFVHEAEVHVVRPDGSIDLAALQNVQTAIDRLGQLELGIGRTPDYTYADAAWDTAGQAADNFAVRVGVTLLAGPLADPFLQGLGMWVRADQMVQSGISDADIRHALTNELVMYGGFSVVAMAGGQLVAANSEWIRDTATAGVTRVLEQLPDDLANAVTRAGQRTMATFEQLSHAGATTVSSAWDRGAAGTWRHAGNLTRIGQLSAANPSLGSAIDDLYHTIDDLGPTGSISSGSSLSSVEQHALDLLRSDPAAYQQAVRSGLVPPEVHRTMNWARDKIVKNAISQTIDDLGDTKWLLNRIDITGTGANPLSVKASSGWTDVDLTALGQGGADRNFQRIFYSHLDDGFGTPNAAQALDVTCFAGRGGSPLGFTDEGLLSWVEVEAHYTGRSVVVSDGGRAVFNYQPDATLTAPSVDPVFGSHTGVDLPSPPQLSSGLGISGAQQDVQRLITSHNAAHPPASVLDDLRVNGKYAQRIWKLDSVGQGAPTEEGIKVLEQIKADRGWVPSPSQLRAATEVYERYTGLTAGGAP